VKVTCAGLSVIILFIVFAFPPFALSDPFMGEGKQAYIERCISTSEMPGRSTAEIEEFCKCFANKLEKGYQDVLKSIKSSDSVALAQQKINSMTQRFARECIGKMP